MRLTRTIVYFWLLPYLNTTFWLAVGLEPSTIYNIYIEYIHMESRIREVCFVEAEKIIEFLKTTYPEQHIKKRSLYFKFNIPYNRQILISDILKLKGVEVTASSICYHTTPVKDDLL